MTIRYIQLEIHFICFKYTCALLVAASLNSSTTVTSGTQMSPWGASLEAAPGVGSSARRLSPPAVAALPSGR